MVNAVGSGGETAKYASGGIGNDWSARHVRLRFEMVITSIIFYFVANYGSETVDFPFINLPEEFQDWYLSVGVLILSVFAIVSFFTRSQYEKALWPKLELSSIKEINKLRTEYSSICSDLDITKVDEKDPEKFFFALFDKEEQLRNFNFSVLSFVLKINNFHNEKGVDSPVHSSFWAGIVPLLLQAENHSTSLLTLSSELELENNVIISRSYVRESIQENYLRRRLELVQTLGKITPEIQERVKALKVHSVIRRFQTTMLSVWVPGISSIALVLCGIYSLLGATLK